MLFINTFLLLGTLGIAIPIAIHLLNRRSSRVVDWGAMNFLLESIAIRNRRIQLEEALLMATRCLLVTLLALALARPFLPPGSSVPWLIVLPLLLLALVGIGLGVILHHQPVWRRRIFLVSCTLLLICCGLILCEKHLLLSRFSPGARQDVALLVDASSSMEFAPEGQSHFVRAVEEARALVKRAPRGHAFCLVVGGPTPYAAVPEPTTDRASLDAALAELRPLEGAMSAYQSLALASLCLARGDNPAKQIVVFSDSQKGGWEIGRSDRWSFLRKAFDNLPSQPQVMLRRYSLPNNLRNLAVTDLRLSRDIVGVDRPVNITVTIRNTGTEAVTPSALVLQVDGEREYRDTALGQLHPGEEQHITFTHQFSESGAHALSATLEVEDELPFDNRSWSAWNIAGELKVLVVEGRPSARPLDRASAFLALALAPSSLTLDPTLTANRPSAADPASDDFQANVDPTLDPVRFLVEPRVVDPAELASIADFSVYDAVLLADVPRLSQPLAASLARYVENGGGLLVTAGPKSLSEFYNGWTTESGEGLLPAQLGDPVVAPAGEAFTPSAQSLTHPALVKVADPEQSDFASASITNYRSQSIPEDRSQSSSVGARLNDGGILLSSRQLGRGKVVLSGIPFDLSSGNLVTRQAFLPFLHELVYQLADPAAYQLNLDAGQEVSLALGGKRGRALGEGLIGRYYRSHDAKDPDVVRLDPAIDFQWEGGSPAPGLPTDGFKVEWTGKIQIPQVKRLTFSAESHHSLELFIDGKPVVEFNPSTKERRYSERVDPDRWYDFRAVYWERGGPARVVLKWEAEKLPPHIIPSSQFRSLSEGAQVTALDGALATFPVWGPDQRRRSAALRTPGGASLLQLQGPISSGPYRLEVPEELAPHLTEFLRPGQREIPFTVKRDPAESQLQPLAESDFAFLNQFVTLSYPQNLEELIGFLDGRQFGQELWQPLVLGALILLILEIVLTRWIARSRRMGEDMAIRFESKDAPSASFREQVAKFARD